MPPTGQYTHARLVGWEVGIWADLPGNLDYFRLDADPEQDMRLKCDQMAGAVRAARTTVAGQGPGHDTLNIFMAPEFFFRGKQGAYPPTVVADIVPTLHGLLGDGWGDWPR